MLTLDIPEGEEPLLTGTLADGRPFITYVRSRGITSNGIWTLEAAELPPIVPLILASDGDVPLGLRAGQTLRVDANGIVGDGFLAGPGSAVIVEGGGVVGQELRAIEADVNIIGGSVGDGFDAFASQVEISGGEIGDQVRAGPGTKMRVSGGIVGDGFLAGSGSTVFIAGGVVGDGFRAEPRSEILISGGEIGESFQARGQSRLVISGGTVGNNLQLDNSLLAISGGTVEMSLAAIRGSEVVVTGGSIGTGFDVRPRIDAYISGGTVADDLSVFIGSNLNLFGTEFAAGGEAIEGLDFGERHAIEGGRTDVTGTLADGNSISIPLGDATMHVTLVSLLDGDYNSDGSVEQGDLDLVLLHWGDELFNPFEAGWINDLPSGAIDQEELEKVLLGWGTAVLAASTAAIPEPIAVKILVTCLACSLCRQLAPLPVRRRGGRRPACFRA